jgi:hypothetical protein
MEIKITAKNQDFHVVLVKMCDFNKRQSIKKTLGRGLFLLFFFDNSEAIQHLLFDCHVTSFI